MRLPFLSRMLPGTRQRTALEPVPLVLYTRAGCHLCEDLVELLRSLESTEPWELKRVDIAADPALEAELGESIPVLTAGGRTVAKGRIERPAFAKRLERAFREYRAAGAVAPRFGGRS